MFLIFQINNPFIRNKDNSKLMPINRMNYYIRIKWNNVPLLLQHDIGWIKLMYVSCYADTVKLVLSDHSKIDITKILMVNGSLQKVESIAECSPWSIL